MGKNLIHIEQKSLKQLNMNFDEFARELYKVCKDALANLGARIVAEAQRTIWRRDWVASSHLVNSGSVKEGRDHVMAGFSSIYAYYVEFGRKAGKWPPARFIRQWILDKHIESDPDYVDNLTFLIQRSIGQKGKRPQPFLRPAYEKNKPLLVKVLKAGAAKVINKDYSKR